MRFTKNISSFNGVPLVSDEARVAQPAKTGYWDLPVVFPISLWPLSGFFLQMPPAISSRVLNVFSVDYKNTFTRRIRGLSGSKSARNDVRIWQYGDG